MKNLCAFTPTLCQLMGIQTPHLATTEVFEDLLFAHTKTIKKALIYCPDAFGNHALQHFPETYTDMKRSSSHEIELLSVVPPVTPVCFASLFTGAQPSQHGIVSYAKPVLKCDTLFDALLRAGKKVAIVAVKNSSVDQIFKNRELDYFSLDYDPLVTAKAMQLLNSNEHDVLVVYHQEYDDLVHTTGPFSEQAHWALQRHVKTWQLLSKAAQQAWKKDFIIAFTPDHGAHEVDGLGDHGMDCPEDMNLKHFYNLF